MSVKEFIFSKLFLKHLSLAVAIAFMAVILLVLGLNIYTRHGQAREVPDFYGKTLDESVMMARKSRMNITIIDSVYTSVVPKGCVAEQNPKPGFKVKKRRTIFLTINAFSPEMVAMPNLVDMSLRQARRVIESSGLVMGSSRYKPDLSVNIVLQQLYNGKEIAGNDSLQKGSLIDLVLGKGLSNQRTAVPDLTGMLLEPARDHILEAALNLGTFTYDSSILTAEDSSKAFVYKQNPDFKEGATLQLGSPIYLWLTVDSLKLPNDSTLMVLPDTLQQVASPQATSL